MSNTLGERLRIAREKKNLKQTQVMAKTGINNKTLSGYEKGVSEPDLETLRILADLYEVSVDWLTGREKDSVDQFIEYLDLELTDEEIMEKMVFKVDNLTLSPEEVKEFIAFVRAKRFMKTGSSSKSSE